MFDFDNKREGTGTREWAEISENIARGCSHNCLYCYAAQNAQRFKTRERSDWSREELTKRASITHYPKRDGVIMFPTAHDITPANVDAYQRVALLMLAAGNKLLIVSKPHLACIKRLCEAFRPYKDSILFRFTIGTLDEKVSRHWEPGAPLPEERIDALAFAHQQGFRTSVSAEPLLGGPKCARELLIVVRPFVTDSVWIGKMNKIRQRVDMKDPANTEAVAAIEKTQCDAEIKRMFDELDGDPIVRWKDSVTEVMRRLLPS